MTVYRTGNHWGVTIVREGAGHHVDDCGCTTSYTDPWCKKGTEAQLVAVVVNGDQALAERICALLNADERQPALLFAAPAAAEALAEVRRRVAALPVSRIVNLSEWNAVQVPDVLAAVDAAAAGLGIDVHGHEHPAGTPPHDHGPRLAIHRGVRGEHTEGHR